jgi:hypothetical protein
VREEYRLMVYENRLLRRIFVPQRGEMTGRKRKLHNEGLHNLYSSSGTIINITTSKMKWAAHLVQMGA